MINEGPSEIIGLFPFRHLETSGIGTTIRDRKEGAAGATVRLQTTAYIDYRDRKSVQFSSSLSVDGKRSHDFELHAVPRPT